MIMVQSFTTFTHSYYVSYSQYRHYIHECIAGVFLSVNGASVQNSSMISYYTEINQEGAERSLACNTDNNGCCEANSEGNWFLANGSVVTLDNREFSVTRSDNGKVILYRKTRIISSTSTLCCKVPDASNINQTVCVSSG